MSRSLLLRAASWLAARIALLLPDDFVRVLLPGKYRYQNAEVPKPPIAPDTKVRLYVAPVNWAGQGWQWARAAERNLPNVGAVTMAYRLGNEFGFPVDQSVPVGAYVASRRWQRTQREAVVAGFSHVLLKAARHPFGRIFDQSVAFQVRELRDHGLSVAMLCHGTEIRLPSRSALKNEFSPFHSGLLASTPSLERAALHNRALLDELGLPVFVSTPDLLLDVPYAKWLPVVVGIDRWESEVAVLERKIPVVVHAPSRGVVKGSDLIDPIMRALDKEGVVSYRRLEAIPAIRMPIEYGNADIVLDQFRIGDYGVAAVEAMSAGRVVVSHVSETARAYVKATTGLDLPIVQATANELEAVIRDILARREHFRKRAAEGLSFAKNVHSGGYSANVLAPFLGCGAAR